MPDVEGLPALEPIDWHDAGFVPPQVLDTPGQLPRADVVLIMWADAEWAATQHVFCASSESMPHSAADASSASGWQKDSTDMIAGPSDWTYWGYFRLVQVGDARVLLYKSNTHLDWPGAEGLTALTHRLASIVQPTVIVSTGTAGGASATDHVGTLVIVNSATLYAKNQAPSSWPMYTSSWTPATTALGQEAFSQLLIPIPITSPALTKLAEQLDQHETDNYSLSQLDPLGLNQPDSPPAIRNLTADGTGLLTASSFLVGTTDDAFAAYGCIEMDDAIIAAACQQAGVQYGSVRNLSDPAQNPALPRRTEGDWGSTVYRTYGLYTSANGALVAWATIS